MDLFSHAEQAKHVIPRTCFAIQRGIPVPTSRESSIKTTWEKPRFNFKDMDVGDCFDVWPQECGNEPLIVVQNFVSGQAATYRKKNSRDLEFTTRQIRGQFVRCWRLK